MLCKFPFYLNFSFNLDFSFLSYNLTFICGHNLLRRRSFGCHAILLNERPLKPTANLFPIVRESKIDHVHLTQWYCRDSTHVNIVTPMEGS